MIDPELRERLDTINNTLASLVRATGSYSGSFFHGILRGAGSLIGVALIIILIGWILNIVGIIPAFQEQVEELKMFMRDIRDLR